MRKDDWITELYYKILSDKSRKNNGNSGKDVSNYKKISTRPVKLGKIDTSLLKDYFDCDTIFKSQGFIWFADEIKYIEYEEIK